MKAGPLNRQITIQRLGSPIDDGFTTTESWTDLTTVYASYKAGVGVERFANAENAATAPVVFGIRSTPITRTINPKDRLQYSGRAYDIASVNELGLNDGLEILAIARVDAD